MDKQELRRNLSTVLGWKLEHRHYPDTLDGMEVHVRTPEWFAIRPDGSEVNLQCSDLHSKVAYWEIVPDWPGDAGAAYLLCLDVLDRLNAKHPDNMWQFTANDCCVSFELLVHGGGIWDSYGADRRDAIGMCEIALAALEAQAVTHD